MNKLILFVTAFLFFSCSESNNKIAKLQNEVDSLKKELSETYKPGFGEFMSSIQSHHAKLWFAGQDENWKLADFEIHEIIEAIDNIKKYETERKESGQIGMIGPALDSVNAAIQHKDLVFFRKSYTNLTNTCNLCHKAVNFEFNIVRIPESQSFSNQDFKVPKPH